VVEETRPVSKAYKAPALVRSAALLLGKLAAVKMLVAPVFTGSLVAIPNVMRGMF
jgi:hypothetical protein